MTPERRVSRGRSTASQQGERVYVVVNEHGPRDTVPGTVGAGAGRLVRAYARYVKRIPKSGLVVKL